MSGCERTRLAFLSSTWTTARVSLAEMNEGSENTISVGVSDSCTTAVSSTSFATPPLPACLPGVMNFRGRTESLFGGLYQKLKRVCRGCLGLPLGLCRSSCLRDRRFLADRLRPLLLGVDVGDASVLEQTHRGGDAALELNTGTLRAES